MRLSPLSFLALGVAAVGGRAAAQDSVKRDVKLPSGAVITRQCAQWRSEGILILGPMSLDRNAAATAYFARLAKVMERRLSHVSRDSTVLVAAFAARVARTGTVTEVRLLKTSGSGGFDMDAQRAAGILAADLDIQPMPEGLPDSMAVLISFGRRQDGSDFLVSHVSCPAMPFPTNPAPVFPVAATISRSRNTVRVRFAVDTLGVVDTAAVEVLDATADAFGNAALDYLSKLKFLPAEFDGLREPQVITKSILFIPPDENGSETR